MFPLLEASKKPIRSAPKKYSEELAQYICQKVATSTKHITVICKEDDKMPDQATIFLWRYKYPDFDKRYTLSMQKKAELMAEEIAQIADDDNQDYYFDHLGNRIENMTKIARDRLRIDTRKWIACKLLPKVYGDRVQQDIDITVTHESKLKELE